MRIANVRGSNEFFVRPISFALITVRLPCIAFRYVALSSLLTANLLPPHFIHRQPLNRKTVFKHIVCAFGLFHAFWLEKITNETVRFNGAVAFFPSDRECRRWMEGVESLDITCETFVWEPGKTISIILMEWSWFTCSDRLCDCQAICTFMNHFPRIVYFHLWLSSFIIRKLGRVFCCSPRLVSLLLRPIVSLENFFGHHESHCAWYMLAVCTKPAKIRLF